MFDKDVDNEAPTQKLSIAWVYFVMKFFILLNCWFTLASVLRRSLNSAHLCIGMLSNDREFEWIAHKMLRVWFCRYFPLRDVQRRYLLDKRRRENAHSRRSLYVLLIFAVCIILAVVLQRWWHVKRGLLKREPSMWGYMMLSQDQLYPSHYNIPSFS